MSAPTSPARGPWQSAKRLSDRTPMRVKLITAVLTLVAIALATISIAGLAYLRSYLISQADSQLPTIASQTNVERALGHYVLSGGAQTGNSEGFSIGWIPVGGSVHWVLREPRNGYVVNPIGSPASPVPTNPNPVVKPGAPWLSGAVTQTVGATAGSGRWRMLAVPSQSLAAPGEHFVTIIGPDGQQINGTMVVALDVSGVYQTLGQLTGIDIIISSILLAGIVVIGIAVIRASLRPLTDIEKTAEAIAGGELSRRVPDHDPRTEVGRLARSLNAMLAQIEAAFVARTASEAAARKSEDRMRQFVADASHELRTPLTILHTRAQLLRRRAGTDPVPGEGLDRLIDDTRALTEIVNDLLLSAELEHRPAAREPVDLTELAQAVTESFAATAERADVSLTAVAHGDGDTTVAGVPAALRRAISALVDNALGHNHPGGTVTVTVARRDRNVELAVVDDGDGLDPSQVTELTKRFARGPDAPGHGRRFGLGLALVREVVHAHGGRLTLDGRPGEGATATITIPAAARDLTPR
jgi:two-component system, OmpR family, sensor kinase